MLRLIHGVFMDMGVDTIEDMDEDTLDTIDHMLDMDIMEREMLSPLPNQLLMLRLMPMLRWLQIWRLCQTIRLWRILRLWKILGLNICSTRSQCSYSSFFVNPVDSNFYQFLQNNFMK